MNNYACHYLPPPAISEYVRSLESLLGDTVFVGIKDADGKYIYANPNLVNFFDTKPELLIGTTDTTWTKGAFGVEIQEKDANVLRTGKTLHCVDNFALKMGNVECATIRFPYKNKNGETVGITFVAVPLDTQYLNGRSGSHTALDNAAKAIHDLQETVNSLKEQVTRDPLTGVWNRRYFEGQANLALEMFNRYGHPASIIFADIDHFKAVNDNYGHAAGDVVLKEFCTTVLGSARVTDLMARWGGEEFVLLLPNSGHLNAGVIAERAREAVLKNRFTGVGNVTASFGIATCRAGEGIDQWVSRADQMMYQAKNNGRNRVEIDTSDQSIDHTEKLTPSFAGLNWRTAYECGNPLIDSQHKRLFEEANELLAAVLGEQPKEEISALINVLLESVTQHFKDEELIFKNTNFPQAEEHCACHQQLTQNALRLAKQFAEDQLDIGELFRFLAYDVVAAHMLAEDRKFFPYLESEFPA